VTDSRQRDLFGTAQASLFDEAEAPKSKAVFQVNPEHVRQWLEYAVAELQGFTAWPWKEREIEQLRSTTWPYFLEKLSNPEEAQQWKLQLETEAARLDKATEWPLTEQEQIKKRFA
jgi:hypothetical protein